MLWIVGDKFVCDSFTALQQLKVEKKDANAESPYMYEHYNVKCFAVDKLVYPCNVMVNLVNSFFKALNEFVHLPRMIIIIPDSDLLRHFDHYTFGITLIAEHCINWVVNTMERAIEARKDGLRRRRQGALNSNEPKVLGVKMFNRVNAGSKLLKFRNKFNSVLEQMLSSRRGHYIIDVNKVVAQPQNFTEHNVITAHGKEVFWRELNKIVEDFDKQKISLRPIAKIFKKNSGNSNQKAQFKMPPPPRGKQHSRSKSPK